LIERLGRAGITQDKDLVREVDALADKVIDLMQSVRDEAILRGDMDTWADSYLPVMLTNEAGNRVKRLANTKGGARTGSDIAASLQTQEPRLTNLIEFNAADGGYRSFTILDAKTIGAKTSQDFAEMRVRAQIPEAEIARQEQIKASIDEFFAPFGATDPNAREQIMRDRARPLLPFELNELAARGHFDALVGGQLVHQGNMWNTDIMSLLHSRIRADRSAEAIAAFKEAIEPFVLTKIEPREIQGVLGKKAQLANGQEITRIGDNRFQVGDQTYRPIATGTVKADSLFVPEMVYGADVGDLLLPDALATGVERLNDILQPENMGPLFALANTTSSIWKTTTLLHLSWPISNAIGNTVLTAMKLPELLNPREAKSYAGDFKNAMKMIVQRNTGGKRYGSMGTVNVGGQMMSVAQLNREMDAARIVNGGVAGDAQRQMMASMMRRVPVGAADNPGTMAEKFIARYERNLSEYASLRGDFGDLSKPVNRMTQLRAWLGAAQQGTVDKALRGLHGWFGANGAIDDVYRTAMYLNLRGKGFDAASAGQQTRQALLNFGDMTSFERNKVRPLVPFYSWMRASLPNMMMRTLRDPKQIAVVPKLTEAMEELLASEGQVPRHMRPRWLQETMAIQIGSDPETARSFQFGTLVPQEAAGQAISGLLGVGGLAGFNGGDVLDAMNWMGGQFGPPVKIPMELATSREAFTGRSIGAEEGDGDITMNQYLAGQIRPFRELGVGNPNPGGLQRAFGEGIGTGIGRLAFGGRLGQNMDTESRQMALSFEMRDKETEIRKAVGRADRRGDQAAGVELRTRLLELYANHIRRGGRPEDVPKWARDDIAGLEAGGF
jgi:dienelactone hydrolase